MKLNTAALEPTMVLCVCVCLSLTTLDSLSAEYILCLIKFHWHFLLHILPQEWLRAIQKHKFKVKPQKLKTYLMSVRL